jgi:hypothetical protein
LAVKLGAPILLSASTCGPSGTIDGLRFLNWPNLTVIGGQQAVSSNALAIVPCKAVADGQIAPGVTEVTRLLPGPRVGHVLTVDERQGVEVRAVTASGKLSGRNTTTNISRQWNALAAVNGDFFLPDGEPVHAFASGGRLFKAPGLIESMVGFDSRQPNASFEGVPNIAMTADISGGPSLNVARVNDGLLSGDEVALYTTEATHSFASSATTCRAALTATGAPSVNGNGDTQQSYTVASAGCADGDITASGLDQLTALAGTTNADAIGNLLAGTSVTFRWRLHPDWAAVLDANGVNLPLVTNGRVDDAILVGTVPFFHERAPRTAIGWLADGRQLLVTVDGRQSGYSIGMTPRELADFMLSLGAVSAANLDGGGSTAMAVRGVLVNRPSDAAGERAVGTALVVVPNGARPQSAIISPTQPFSQVDPSTDSASLGGWLALQAQR